MRLKPLSAVAFAVTSLLTLGAASVQAHTSTTAAALAKCAQWNVTGTWRSSATNNFHVAFRFAQKGTHVTGAATIPPAEATIVGYATGTLTGTVKGSHLRIVVIWAPRASDHVQLHAVYTGTVVKNHVIGGFGRDVTTKPAPGAVAWSASGPSRCSKA
jgi:hypothetical protein